MGPAAPPNTPNTDMRAIIRISIDQEKNGALRNALVAILEQNGFVPTNATATFENPNIDIQAFAHVMCQYWNTAATPQGVGGIQVGAHLDHTWIYVDEKA